MHHVSVWEITTYGIPGFVSNIAYCEIRPYSRAAILNIYNIFPSSFLNSLSAVHLKGNGKYLIYFVAKSHTCTHTHSTNVILK